jgi:hypothetical protein
MVFLFPSANLLKEISIVGEEDTHPTTGFLIFVPDLSGSCCVL